MRSRKLRNCVEHHIKGKVTSSANHHSSVLLTASSVMGHFYLEMRFDVTADPLLGKVLER